MLCKKAWEKRSDPAVQHNSVESSGQDSVFLALMSLFFALHPLGVGTNVAGSKSLLH